MKKLFQCLFIFLGLLVVTNAFAESDSKEMGVHAFGGSVSNDSKTVVYRLKYPKKNVTAVKITGFFDLINKEDEGVIEVSLNDYPVGIITSHTPLDKRVLRVSEFLTLGKIKKLKKIKFKIIKGFPMSEGGSFSVANITVDNISGRFIDKFEDKGDHITPHAQVFESFTQEIKELERKLKQNDIEIANTGSQRLLEENKQLIETLRKYQEIVSISKSLDIIDPLCTSQDPN